MDDTKAKIAQGMTPKLENFAKDAEQYAKKNLKMFEVQRKGMAARHRNERHDLWAAHEKRWLSETKQRAQNLPRGFVGIWQRVTGRYAKAKSQNERDTLRAWQRDRAEKDALIFKHIDERQPLQQNIKQQRDIANNDLMELRKDVANYKKFELDRQKHEREKQEKARRKCHRRLEP